jgi:hypothetical protein
MKTRLSVIFVRMTGNVRQFLYNLNVLTGDECWPLSEDYSSKRRSVYVLPLS